MADRDERGAGMSDRMKQRFDSEPSGPSDSSESSEPSDKVRNIKEEWNGRYFYLPDSVDDRVASEYNRLVYECGRDLDWEPDKNRHFYPVVITAGLGSIEEMGPEEFLEAVEALD